MTFCLQLLRDTFANLKLRPRITLIGIFLSYCAQNTNRFPIKMDEKLHKKILADIGQALRELVVEMKEIRADIRKLPIEAVVICVSNPESIFLSEYVELENFIQTAAKDEIHRRSVKQFTSMSSGRIKRDPMYLGYLRKPKF